MVAMKLRSGVWGRRKILGQSEEEFEGRLRAKLL